MLTLSTRTITICSIPPILSMVTMATALRISSSTINTPRPLSKRMRTLMVMAMPPVLRTHIRRVAVSKWARTAGSDGNCLAIK